jgi:glycolate oxidase FAD binding subunit
VTAGTGGLADAGLARVERPGSVDAAASLLRDTSGSVLFRGAGTKLDWAGPVREPELVLDTTGLNGVLEHNAADLTVAVRGGTPLADLQKHLRPHGQWLAMDPPSARHGATLGGLLATGDSGPSRLRYGGLRDQVIGTTLVLADGTVAHSGGHVIKNVAGYDLTKLMHGSLGTLGLIAEVVLRLSPLPAASVTLVGDADVVRAWDATARLMAGTLEPAAVEWIRAGGADRFVVRMDGHPQALTASVDRVRDVLTEAGIAAVPLDDGDATALWDTHADQIVATDGEAVLRMSGLPGDLVEVVRRVDVATAETGVEADVVSSTALGLHTVRLRAAPADRHAAVVTALRRCGQDLGANVLLRRRPPGLEGLVDPVGPAPSWAVVLRRIKAQFDPAGRCAPGRLAPWY